MIRNKDTRGRSQYQRTGEYFQPCNRKARRTEIGDGETTAHVASGPRYQGNAERVEAPDLAKALDDLMKEI